MSCHEQPKQDGADPLRFEVPSDKADKPPHVVDLGSWGGLGECTCEHYQFRNLTLARNGDRDPRLRCKHILRARSSFADSMVARILQIRPRENDTEQN